MEHTMEASSEKSSIKLCLIILLVLSIGCVIFVNFATYPEREMVLATEDGTETLYYVTCRNYMTYVKTINDMAFDDSITLSDCNFPDRVYYSDSDGNNYYKDIESEDDYIEILNLCYVNKKFTINDKLLPHFRIFYTKN